MNGECKQKSGDFFIFFFFRCVANSSNINNVFRQRTGIISIVQQRQGWEKVKWEHIYSHIYILLYSYQGSTWSLCKRYFSHSFIHSYGFTLCPTTTGNSQKNMEWFSIFSNGSFTSSKKSIDLFIPIFFSLFLWYCWIIHCQFCLHILLPLLG